MISTNDEIKQYLHCPIDSKILGRLGITSLKLNSISLEQYIGLQTRISELIYPQFKVDFDNHWDEQHLNDEGLL